MAADDEIVKAKEIIQGKGKKPEEFCFEVEQQPPDMETPGMFILRYSVTVSANGSATKQYNGGLDRSWVSEFEEDLATGYFG